MGRAAVVIGLAGAAVVGWVVAPVVDLARRGTSEERAIRAWRREGALRRQDDAEDRRIPDQRRPDEGSDDVVDPALEEQTRSP